MKVEQQRWSEHSGWSDPGVIALRDAQLVWIFGAGARLADPRTLQPLRRRFPSAAFFGCSTAGEIAGTTVNDDTIVATALEFDSTEIRATTTAIAGPSDSRAAGRRLAEQLPADGLTHVFVLSDGLAVNGSELAEGLAASVRSGTLVTGGLAADGSRFEKTMVVSGDEVRSGIAAAVGLYGPRLKVGCASLGGWDSFGPERIVTRAVGNVLYELDGQSALGLYRRYLGNHAHELPASGLLFPLAVRLRDDDEPIVRTILAVDDTTGSLTFAGDVPEGARARLMKANFDRLIDGATGAARVCQQSIGTSQAEFGLLISCVGRKLVLKQRTEEEVEAVRDVVGPQAALAGFYSYGEISPFTPTAKCQLHNQTMTLTTLTEL